MTHTVKVTNGPGSEMLILSLHCILRNEKAPIVDFEVGGKIRLPILITGIDMIECIEGGSVFLKGAYAKDVKRLCNMRPVEREEKEFIFPSYQHHSREGFVQIPKAYLTQIMEELKV